MLPVAATKAYGPRFRRDDVVEVIERAIAGRPLEQVFTDPECRVWMRVRRSCDDTVAEASADRLLTALDRVDLYCTLVRVPTRLQAFRP